MFGGQTVLRHDPNSSISGFFMFSRHLPLTTLTLLSALLTPTAGLSQPAVTPDDLSAFVPRLIGPAVTGGRIHDVEALADDPSIIYVASASGGLWKSNNRGQTWTNVSDGWFGTGTFGDLAVAPSNSMILYAGTGEQNNRQSTSWGDGVYRSDDGGASWRHLGLANTRHIGKVEVHPTNPDIAWVAAQGNLWTPSEDRGVFRTTDGGESWEKVLYVDEFSGAVDLVINPTDPDIVYAAIYPRLRKAWGFNGGAESGGIFRSTDGGESWEELTGGIPAGATGRIGLAISATDPHILNAVIEHEDSEAQGTYRSEDGGDSWERVNSLNPRPMFYSEIFIDPTDPKVVYVLGTNSYRSENAGRDFEEIADSPTYDVGVHRDHHALWIDPTDPEHLYFGTDGGFLESYDAGRTFRKFTNLPIGQFYGIGVDMRDPYRVYGGMQDNHSWMAPSETRSWTGILNGHWQQTGFSDGMFQRPDPTSARYVYANSWAGRAYRFDALTGQSLPIQPEAPEGEDGYRWDWISPILISPHDPETIYLAAERLFISHDRGESFTRTRDLTKDIDPDDRTVIDVAQGEVTVSAREGPGGYSQITAIGESPAQAGVLWVGADDGRLQLSRDGGESWTAVDENVPGAPEEGYVRRVVPSVRGAGVAYLVIDNHREGDFTPYIYMTEDYGASWTRLNTSGIDGGSVLSLAEHPDNPDLLFAGAEHGLFASTDAGAHWVRMETAPVTAYDDILIHPREKDLVLGTHGRSIWILDDTTPLAEWTAPNVDAPAHLFSVRDEEIFVYWKDDSYQGDAEFFGENPPDGAILTYRLGPGDDTARIRVTDEDGRVVWDQRVPSTEGVHRVNWDLRHEPMDGPDTWEPHLDPELAHPIGEKGPRVSPGEFTVTLEARGVTSTTTMTVLPDPASPYTQADYEAREDFMLELRELIHRAEASRPDLSCGFGSGRSASGEEPTLEETLCSIRNGASSLMRGLSGRAARQGTLHPPTTSMLEAKAELEAKMNEITGGQ